MSNKTGIPKKPFFGLLSLSNEDQLMRVKALLESANGVPETCSGWFTVGIVNPSGFMHADGTYYPFGSSLSTPAYCEFEVLAHDQREVLVRLTSAPQNAGAQGAMCFIPKGEYKMWSARHAEFLGEFKAERAKATSLYARRHPKPRAPITLTLKRSSTFFWNEARLRGGAVARDMEYYLPAGSTLTEISRDDESVLAVFYCRHNLHKRDRALFELKNGCPEGAMVVVPVSEFDKL